MSGLSSPATHRDCLVLTAPATMQESATEAAHDPGQAACRGDRSGGNNGNNQGSNNNNNNNYGNNGNGNNNNNNNNNGGAHPCSVLIAAAFLMMWCTAELACSAGEDALQASSCLCCASLCTAAAHSAANPGCVKDAGHESEANPFHANAPMRQRTATLS